MPFKKRPVSHQKKSGTYRRGSRLQQPRVKRSKWQLWRTLTKANVNSRLPKMKWLQIELRNVLSSVAQGSHIFEIIDTLFDQLDIAQIHCEKVLCSNEFCLEKSSKWFPPFLMHCYLNWKPCVCDCKTNCSQDTETSHIILIIPVFLHPGLGSS